MEHHGGIDEVVGVPCLADGGRLEELVALKAAALAVGLAGGDEHRLLPDGEHIRAQHRAHGAVAALVAGKAEAGVQVGVLPLGEDAGVKLGLVPLSLAQQSAVGVVDVAVELELPGGGIAHRHGDHALFVQHIVEVVPAVGALGDVRGVEAHAAVGVEGVLGLFVDDALVAPVAQVVHRGGPGDVVVQAVGVAVKAVVRAVDVHPAVKDVGLPVRDVLPRGKVRVKGLLFHEKTPLRLAGKAAACRQTVSIFPLYYTPPCPRRQRPFSGGRGQWDRPEFFL